MPTQNGPPSGFPTPSAGQVQVLLLGTIHMETSRIDDVLDDPRQRQFEALADTLTAWNPDGVAVERSYDTREHVDRVYDEYRRGDRAYDAEEHIEPARKYVDDPTATCRNETVQVGFRLADRLDHEHVHCVDDLMPMDAHVDEELDDDSFASLVERGAATLPDSLVPERADWLPEWEARTVESFLRWFNQPERLLTGDENHYLAAFGGFEERYGGAKLLTGLYERNLRMAENIWRAATDDDLDRVLLVVGQAHVHLLRHMLGTMPGTCPVSPVSVLEA
ncbi:DUF5694 domain-containing protein [Halorubellus litoreus]|uniref:DUF5694 domain-containing protein n=1 Tax=Halorubellus litoreus TaxID=755308 RepID=A0ABD5VI61_9EURY